MNTKYAQSIPLREILNKIGLHPAQQNNSTSLYPSPFKDGAMPSLQVNSDANTWCDSATEISGGPVELVQTYLANQKEKCSILDVLHWLKFNIGYPALSTFLSLPNYTEEDSKYAFKAKTLLLEGGLVRYVESRGLPISIARKYLQQIYVLNKITGKEFLALGLKNEDSGFAIRSRFIKANLGPAAIFFIRAKQRSLKYQDKPEGVHVFKDIFDYMSAMINRDGKPFSEDCTILTSYLCMDNAAAYIRGYGYRKLYTWLDNGEIGKKATGAFAFLCETEESLQHIVMNNQYAPYFDVNACLIAKLEA